MKQNTYTKLIAAMLAVSCFCCSCGKDATEDSTKAAKNTEAEISSSLSKETSNQTTHTVGESSSEKTASISGKETPASDKETSGPEKETSKPASSDPSEDTSSSDPTGASASPLTSQTPVSDNSALGTGNLSNGGFATGDKQNVYYVTYTSKERITIMKEDRSSKTTTPIYTTVPKNDPAVDDLNIVGDTLYFRENQSETEKHMIVKLDVNDLSFDVLDDGDIDSLTVYKDHLYYADNCNLVSCDLDGKNKTVLYESEHTPVPPKIAYCFMDNKIFFATPGEYDKDGYFFGKLCSMDPDGKNLTQIPVEADVCNSEAFLSDGKLLYFFGNSEKDGLGFYSCKLDGSDLTAGDKSMPRSMNFISGKYIMSTDAELFMKKDSDGYELIDSGNIRWGKIVLIGNDLYYFDYDAKQEDSLPVMTRLSLLGGKSEKLG